MRREQYPQRLNPTNIVHHTEQGRLFLQRMVDGLRIRDSIPGLPTNYVGRSGKSAAELINELRARLRRVDNFDAAVNQIKACEYFEDALRGHTVLIAQSRNDLPSDVTIAYRHAAGEFQLEAMYSVAHDDPTGPLVVGPWLLPATKVRTTSSLRRYVFGLHEFTEPEELFESYVYRTIYNDRRMSWHAIVLARDKRFTWVLYVWFSVDDYTKILEVVTNVRAGLSQIAPVLGELFERLLADEGSACKFIHEDSIHKGLLTFDLDFRRLRRQNFAAEMMLQGLTDPYQIAVLRASVYNRLRLEYSRRLTAGLPTRWLVDAYCHPTDFYPADVTHLPALEVEVEVRPGSSVHPPEMVVSLRELHLPHLPSLKTWRLSEHTTTGVATSLRKLGSEYREGEELRELPDGYFIKATMCIARPVWDIDIIADRVQHYHRVEATDLGRKGLQAVDFKTYPMCALLFRGAIIGVLQAV